MHSRHTTCLLAAAAMGILAGAAGIATAAPRGDVVIKGRTIDPSLQRKVSYADLDLARQPGQKVLGARIRTTANRLCYDLNGEDFLRQCTEFAVHSTDDQVAAAIERAQRRLAGLPVGPSIPIAMRIGF